MSRKGVLAIILVLCSFQAARSEDKPRVLRIGNEESIDLTPFLEELRGDRSLKEAREATWTPVDGVPNYGFQTDVFFFRVRIESEKEIPRIFVIDASIRDLDLFIVRDGIEKPVEHSFGRMVPPDEFSPAYRTHLRKIQIPAG